MSSSPKARFSTGVSAIKDGPKFQWERPVPDNSFWSTFRYPSARNFLDCFTDEEVDAMQLQETHGDLSNAAKSAILIEFLENKIATSEVDGVPLYRTDNKKWMRIKMAIGTLYGETGQLAEQIAACDELIEKQEDKSNLSHQHALAWLLNQRGEKGDYVRAEGIERPCTAYMDEHVGSDSPQSMSSRRIVAKAVWMQGRFGEAEMLLGELFGLIREMGGGKFAVYEESERKMTEEMAEEMKRLKPGSST
jgi:hypothetical protein